MPTPHTGLPRPLARTAGLLYLVIIVCGLFAEGAVRGSLLDATDPAATVAAIRAHSGWFRLGLAADLLMLLADVAVAVVLYLLFVGVHRPLALAAAAFRLIQAAVLGLNLLHHHAALLLLSQGVVPGLDEAGRQALALLFLELHAHGYDLGLLFFAVATACTGLLLCRLPGRPPWLGVALLAAALVYLLGGLLRFLAPTLLTPFQPLYLIPVLAELGLCLWLLWGAGRGAPPTAGPPSTAAPPVRHVARP